MRKVGSQESSEAGLSWKSTSMWRPHAPNLVLGMSSLQKTTEPGVLVVEIKGLTKIFALVN